jgi:hypothetical protein
MKWLLILGGAYLLLSKRPGQASVQAPVQQYPAVQSPGRSMQAGDVVDRVKDNVNNIIEDVRSWWDSVADQNVQTPSQPMPPTAGPMYTDTAAFS